jgi:hypothetical protein
VGAAYRRRKVEGTLLHDYSQSPYWPQISGPLAGVLELLDKFGSLVDIATASTRCLLDLVGRQGRIVKSSDMAPAPSDRSAWPI